MKRIDSLGLPRKRSGRGAMMSYHGGRRGEGEGGVVRAEGVLAKNSLAHEESSRAEKATGEATKRKTQRINQI